MSKQFLVQVHNGAINPHSIRFFRTQTSMCYNTKRIIVECVKLESKIGHATRLIKRCVSDALFKTMTRKLIYQKSGNCILLSVLEIFRLLCFLSQELVKSATFTKIFSQVDFRRGCRMKHHTKLHTFALLTYRLTCSCNIKRRRY